MGWWEHWDYDELSKRTSEEQEEYDKMLELWELEQEIRQREQELREEVECLARQLELERQQNELMVPWQELGF